MFKTNIYVLILIISLVFAGCDSKTSKKDTGSAGKKEEKAKAYLPDSAGEPNAILVVMDTAAWSGPVGDALRDVFSNYVPGLPREEPYFKIRNINPTKFNSILKRGSNLMFVYTLDDKTYQGRQMRNFFTDESLKIIANDSSRFMLAQKNVYAKDQAVMHLFGQTEAQIINKLQANKKRLINHFTKIENTRMSKGLFKVREKQIEKRLANEYDFTFKIPFGFEAAKMLKDFVWIRQLDQEIEKNIFVYFRPYDSKDAFDDVMDYRERITSMHMRDVEKPEIYMTLQDTLAQVREVNFKGAYAKEVRGLWKLSDISGGGPFLSYVFVDEKQKRIYYLEGYVYAPSKDKRVLIQEIEVILSSFESSLKK